MDFKVLKVQQDDDGRRLDRIIKVILPNKGLGEINALIRKGLIRINEKKAKNDSRVVFEDEIQVASFLLENLNEEKTAVPLTLKTEFSKLEIVFQNRHLLFINKPYDKTVHGFNDSLDVSVKELFSKTKNETSLSFKPGPLHRLDKKTTGLLCFSWSLEGAKWFSQNIKTHVIKKYYIGIVEGKLETQERWENYIEKNSNDVTSKFHTVSDSSDGKISITYASPVKYGKYKYRDITLVSFRIETGRTHQIRFQSSAHKHPLLGDTAYGGTPINEKQNFYLHAEKLEIGENTLDLPQIIECPICGDFEDFLKKHF